MFKWYRKRAFQFLIGTVKTSSVALEELNERLFQFLIGTVKTYPKVKVLTNFG